MWTSIRLQNFGPFADTGSIELRPLTIFIGPNSSGKSTIFKSLLALRQTLESRDMEKSLVTEGDYCSLGEYRDFVFKNDKKKEVSFDIKWNSKHPLPYDSCHDQYKISVVDNFKVGWKMEGTNIVISYFEYIDIYSKSTIRIERKNGKYLLSSGIEEIQRITPESGQPYKFHRLNPETLRKFAPVLEWALKGIPGDLENEISSTIYLGPLRPAPKRIYQLSQEQPIDVGLKGEFTADALALNRKLVEEANFWLSKLGLGKKLKIEKLKGNIGTIKITNSLGQTCNLTDVGFGISQVLPVIVEGLFSKPWSCLLFEQPELHLNPKIQTEMGDFFIDLTEPGRKIKQVIIETHSEHLLSRIRTRIAQERINPDRVAIYYCRPGKAGAKLSRLKINENGQFTNWPKGFFAEEIRETLKQTKAVFNRKSREANKN